MNTLKKSIKTALESNTQIIDMITTGYNKYADTVSTFGILNAEGITCFQSEDEQTLIEEFIHHLTPHTLITYNGKDYLFPFLTHRAKKHNLALPTTITSLDVLQQLKKRNAYHCLPNLKLSTVAAAIDSTANHSQVATPLETQALKLIQIAQAHHYLEILEESLTFRVTTPTLDTLIHLTSQELKPQLTFILTCDHPISVPLYHRNDQTTLRWDECTIHVAMDALHLKDPTHGDVYLYVQANPPFLLNHTALSLPGDYLPLYADGHFAVKNLISLIKRLTDEALSNSWR